MVKICFIKHERLYAFRRMISPDDILFPLSKHHFTTSSLDTTKQLYQKLTIEKVLVTLQAENIRVSPNFFNTKDEISTFLSLI